MRKLCTALFLTLGLLSAVQAQTNIIPSTQQQISVTGTVAASTKIISGIAGLRIYVTAIALVPVATSVVTLTYGTGTNCGTGTTAISGVMTFAAGQVLTLGDGYGAVYVIPTGNDVCITIATQPAPGSIAYGQF